MAVHTMRDSNCCLNILLITSDKYPPFRPAARVIFGQELGKRGHRIDWVLQSQKSQNKLRIINGGNGSIYIGPKDGGVSRLRRVRKHFQDIVNDLRMFSLARKKKYDLIQVKDKYVSAVFAIVLAKFVRMKYFYWIAFPHGEASIYQAQEGVARYRYFYYMRGYFFKLLLYKIILPAADHVFVQSEQMKKDIAKEGIEQLKMTAIPGSVNLSEVPYKNSKCSIQNSCDGDKPTIVYLGTLNRIRRLDFMLRVLVKVCDEMPGAKLFLIGKGDMREDEEFLQSEAVRLGVKESVIFTGYIPMNKAWEYIRMANVCVSPYYPTPILLSTSPTKIIEYMAMGKPVVANDHPEQNLILSESGAGICVPWQEAPFSTAILEIIRDPVKARKMGERGRRYVEEKRTNEIMANVIEKTYYGSCKASECSSL